MEDPIANFVQLLQARVCGNNEIMSRAEATYMAMQQENPNHVLQILIQIVQTQGSGQVLILTLMTMKSLLNFHQQFQGIAAETVGVLLQTLQTCVSQIGNYTPMEMDYIFIIVSQMIPNVVRMGQWPGIWEIMMPMVTTPLCARALDFFADFVSSVSGPEWAPRFATELATIAGFVSFDYPDPNARRAVLRLSYNLIICGQLPPDLFGGIPNVIMSLPDDDRLCDKAITDFSLIYSLNRNILCNACEGMVLCFLALGKDVDRTDATRISALEMLTDMVRWSPVIHRFILAHMGDFADTMRVTLSNACDEFGERSGVYDAAVGLLECLDEKSPEAMAAFEQLFKGNCAAFGPLGISSILRVRPINDLFDQTLEMIAVPDELICENIAESLNVLFSRDKIMKRLIRGGKIPEVATKLFELVAAGRTPVIGAVASLCESLQNRPDILGELAQTIIGIGTGIKTADSMRCVAAVARAFPEQLAPQAGVFATDCIRIISEGVTASDKYALMVSTSAFTKVMPDGQRAGFLQELLRFVEQNEDILMWESVREIAKQIGPQFAVFLPTIVPMLMAKAAQEIRIETEIVSQEISRDEFSVMVPGMNKVVTFNNEQFREISLAAESLADYAIATGEAFAPYIEAVFAVGRALASVPLDDMIRKSGITLLKSLALAHPGASKMVVEALLQCYFGNEAEGDFGELLSDVCATLIGSLEELLTKEGFDKECQALFLSMAVPMVNKAVRLVRQAEQEDVLDVEEQDHVDALWSIASIMKHFYKDAALLEPAVQVVAGLIQQLPQDLAAEPIMLISEFTAAIWSDFMIYAMPPEALGQFQALFQQLVVGGVQFEEPHLRSMCLFAVGKVAKRQPPALEMIDQLLQMCMASINGRTDNEEFFGANACAISSYARLLLRRLTVDPSGPQIDIFLKMFPPREDMPEVAMAYKALMRILCHLTPDTAGFTPQIYQLIMQGLADEDNCDEVRQQLDKFVASATPAAVALVQFLQSQ